MGMRGIFQFESEIAGPYGVYIDSVEVFRGGIFVLLIGHPRQTVINGSVVCGV